MPLAASPATTSFAWTFGFFLRKSRIDWDLLISGFVVAAIRWSPGAREFFCIVVAIAHMETRRCSSARGARPHSSVQVLSEAPRVAVFQLDEQRDVLLSGQGPMLLPRSLDYRASLAKTFSFQVKRSLA